MSNVTISPNMSLTIPVTGQEPGPDWANDINNSLSVIDAHNHAPGSGVQINPDGININADLTFGSNNATALRSVRYTINPSPLAGVSDLSCGYSAGVNGDLYWNDGLGNQIRITQGGSVAGSSGTITGLPSGTASAAYVSGSGTFVFQQSTSTGANLDVASIAIRYPGSYPTPAGNYIQLQAPSSLATGYSITLPATAPGTSGAFLTESTAGVVSYTNIDNSSLAISSNILGIKANGVAQSALALRSTGTSVGAGGIALSASSGFFGTFTNPANTSLGMAVSCKEYVDSTYALASTAVAPTASIPIGTNGMPIVMLTT